MVQEYGCLRLVDKERAWDERKVCEGQVSADQPKDRNEPRAGLREQMGEHFCWNTVPDGCAVCCCQGRGAKRGLRRTVCIELPRQDTRRGDGSVVGWLKWGHVWDQRCLSDLAGGGQQSRRLATFCVPPQRMEPICGCCPLDDFLCVRREHDFF